MPTRQPFHCILPPDLLDRLARTGDEVVRNAALDTLQLDQLFRLTRAEMASRLGGRLARPITFGRIGGKPQRTIYDQQHATTRTPRRSRYRRVCAGSGHSSGRTPANIARRQAGSASPPP